MHLLAARPGAVADGSEAVDLGQSPGDLVVLSAADTELACLAAARARLPEHGFPSLRLASLLHLGHNMSVDLYVENTLARARFEVLVPEELLDGAYVIAVLDEMRCEVMSEAMAAGRFGNPRGTAGVSDSPLYHGFVKVVATAFGGGLVDIGPRCGEQPLPSPFA